jgi:lysozyme
MKKAGLFLLAALVLGLALWRYALVWRPSERSYPVQGVDVSHHQGRIDWSKLRGEGVDFAYIKASEGGGHRDRSFAFNWREAEEAGVKRGAYHFFTLCRSGEEQAANFIATVPPAADALAPAVDLEFGGNCAARPSRAALLVELSMFLRLVEAHAGKPALLYLTREFDEHYRVSAAIRRPLWLRSIVLKPGYGARPWCLWQASSFRRVQGVVGPIDWNVARLDSTAKGLACPA